MSYAAKTIVPVERTKAAIEKLVKRYGAKGFAVGWHNDRAQLSFVAHDRQIRFTIVIPPQAQAERVRWRILLLLVKAKLEAVDAKVVTFEEAFVGDIVMPQTGKTVWETAREGIALAYKGNPTPLSIGVDHGRTA
jgi:hypothetical protein